MNLQFYNCPEAESIEVLGKLEVPGFVSYKPDFKLLEDFKKAYAGYENILVIAHGGSVSPILGFYGSLKYSATKNVVFLSTVDPDYITELKTKYKPENTLVISVSKSGDNMTQLETFSQFLNYPNIVVTGKSSPLRAIAEKIKSKIVMHPPIGGRYTGLTEVNLLPAAIAGLDVKALYEGALEYYHSFEKENDSFKTASIFWQLEQKGFVDVFMPFYSHNLFPMSAIIVQLCHESFGKAGKGQTYFAHEAPESQHHTNQRFFGGQKNIAGFFFSAKNFQNNSTVVYPAETHSVQIRGRHVADVSKIPLEKIMQFELQGTLEDAKINSIPLAHLEVENFSAFEMGKFSAFWQLYAVYSSLLRGVDPYNQPQVENSKNISFSKRLQYKGLL